MHKKRNIVIAICLLAMVMMATGASWDGSAMMGGYGDFPPSGYYAACNSFPRNTAVEVLNLENGRTVRVIVTRNLDSAGVFMMLSVEAANAIGIQSGRVARIRASDPRSSVELVPSGSAGASYDLDFNPRLLAEQELKRLGYDLKPSGKPSETVPPVVTSTRSVPATPTPEPALVEPATTKPKAAIGPADDSTIVLDTGEPLEDSDGPESPELLASAKPKPVRTIVLPQLPAPTEPVALGVEASAMPSDPARDASTPLDGRPLPDETPLRVRSSVVPRLYDGPTLLPDVSTRGLGIPVQATVSMALSEPAILDAIKIASSEESSVVDKLPTGAPESAIAIARHAPDSMHDRVEAELAWPVLPADELPELVLTFLSPPAMKVPATSLAEGEIRLSEKEIPSLIALETPSFDAAETLVSLEDADPPLEEKPSVIPQDTTIEYVVTLEPSDPKPPLSQAIVPPAPASKPIASVTLPSSPVAITTLEKGRYYIQVGAYGSEAVAKETASGLAKGFSSLIEKSSVRGKDCWKVYVGPLSRDESGVALVRVRALGYKDAFVKSGS